MDEVEKGIPDMLDEARAFLARQPEYAMHDVAGMPDKLVMSTYLLVIRERGEGRSEGQERDWTGFYSDVGFRKYAQARLEKAEAERKPCALAKWDLVRFKAVNDNYGEAVGDRIIEEYLRRLQAKGHAHGEKPHDILAHGKGDEANVLLSEANCSVAEAYVARVLGAWTPFVVDVKGSTDVAGTRWCKRELPIFASVGITDTALVGSYDLEQLLETADIALHLAKKGKENGVSEDGRPTREAINSCTIWEPGTTRETPMEYYEPVLQMDETAAIARILGGRRIPRQQ